MARSTWITNKFQSTPSPRRATLQSAETAAAAAGISIHALPAEGDRKPLKTTKRSSRISIHALPAEGDLIHASSSNCPSYFNPRPPRGGRHSCLHSTLRQVHFNPRPPRGGRLRNSTPLPTGSDISIHALPAEGDLKRFNWTFVHISHFNPRPPRGGRPDAGGTRPPREARFQSTPSPRRATDKQRRID